MKPIYESKEEAIKALIEFDSELNILKRKFGDDAGISYFVFDCKIKIMKIIDLLLKFKITNGDAIGDIELENEYKKQNE